MYVSLLYLSMHSSCGFPSPEQRWKVDQNFLLGTEGGEGEGEAPVIEGDNENTKQLEQCVAAKFHFVDLAGSERVSRTGNRGERFKGTVHIIYFYYVVAGRL